MLYKTHYSVATKSKRAQSANIQSRKIVCPALDQVWSRSIGLRPLFKRVSSFRTWSLTRAAREQCCRSKAAHTQTRRTHWIKINMSRSSTQSQLTACLPYCHLTIKRGLSQLHTLCQGWLTTQVTRRRVGLAVRGSRQERIAGPDQLLGRPKHRNSQRAGKMVRMGELQGPYAGGSSLERQCRMPRGGTVCSGHDHTSVANRVWGRQRLSTVGRTQSPRLPS